MRLHSEGEDITIVFVEKFREYGIPVPGGGSSYILMNFCPWCGVQLHASLRKEWFDALEERGIDPFGNDVPDEFTDSRWYQPNVR